MANPTANNIIFNVSKGNPTETSISSRFFQVRNQNIVDKVEDYYIRVFEAKVPITEIPYFIMKDNVYSVTINDQQVDRAAGAICRELFPSSRSHWARIRLHLKGSNLNRVIQLKTKEYNHVTK